MSTSQIQLCMFELESIQIQYAREQHKQHMEKPKQQS